MRCPTCKGEHILAFSCQPRNLSTSCQAKRSGLLTERLRDEILAPVPHRHCVFTITEAFRDLFERERPISGPLSRRVDDAIKRSSRVVLDRQGILPSTVASLRQLHRSPHPGTKDGQGRGATWTT